MSEWTSSLVRHILSKKSLCGASMIFECLPVKHLTTIKCCIIIQLKERKFFMYKTLLNLCVYFLWIHRQSLLLSIINTWWVTHKIIHNLINYECRGISIHDYARQNVFSSNSVSVVFLKLLPVYQWLTPKVESVRCNMKIDEVKVGTHNGMTLLLGQRSK